MRSRRSHSALAAAAALAAALALATCGGGNGDENAEEDRGPPTPAEAYSEIVAEIAEQGSSPELALEAFTLAFGSIPGAERPETSDGPNILSGTGAVRLVLRHWDELPSEQQAAIEERLIPPGLRTDEPPADADGAGASRSQPAAAGVKLASAVSRPGPAGASASPAGCCPGRNILAQAEDGLRAHLSPELQGEAERIAASLAARMGADHRRTFWVGLPANEYSRERIGPAGAWSVGVDAAERSGQEASFDWVAVEGPYDGCLILINPEEPREGARFDGVLAHEVFHCLANEILGLRQYRQGSAWVTEGLAAWAGEVWAGEQGGGGSRYDENWWELYFSDRRELFAQSYDAIGFWAQLDALLTGQLWPQAPAILNAAVDSPDDAVLSRALSGVEDQFLVRWAPQQARQPDFGGNWDLRDFDSIFAVPSSLRRAAEKLDLGTQLSQAGDSFRFTLVGRLRPKLLWFRMPDSDEIDAVRVAAKGYGAMVWQEPPQESTEIRGNDSRTIRLSDDCPGADPVRRGNVLIVALASRTDSYIEFSAEECEEEEVGLSCGGKHPTLEAAVATCLSGITEPSSGVGYTGICKDPAVPGFCSSPLTPGGHPDLEGLYRRLSDRFEEECDSPPSTGRCFELRGQSAAFSSRTPPSRSDNCFFFILVADARSYPPVDWHVVASRQGCLE